ncbi:MAG: tetratricopeptide repeat protein [Sphingomonas bacterium]
MESAKHSSRTGLIVLVVAALVLVGAISFAALRSATSEKNAAPPPATPVANQPPTLESLQERTRAEPTNVEAWLALAQAQFDAGDYKGAVAAYEHGIQLAPQRADIWSALGEARTSATSDPMPPDALAAFRKAVAINPKEPRARYFLAVARDLAKDHQGAIDDWLALLRDTPPGAPWENDLRRTIEQVGRINHINVAPQLAATKQAAHPLVPDASIAGAAIPGPSPDQMRAAASLPADQQNAMIQGMVGKLEAKLQANPSNVEGWIMLMRSRVTLGEPAKASAALKAAIAANPGAKAQLLAEARTLGVPGA